MAYARADRGWAEVQGKSQEVVFHCRSSVWNLILPYSFINVVQPAFVYIVSYAFAFIVFKAWKVVFLSLRFTDKT